MKPIRLVYLVLLAGFISGCSSVVTSTREITLPDVSKPVEGMRYFLPRARLQVYASWNNLIPGWEPKFCYVPEADPGYCYRLTHNGNAFFDESVVVAVDPSTGLLTGASATTTDQSVNALASLVSAAGAVMVFGASLHPMASTSREPRADQAELEDIRRNAYSSSFSQYLTPDHPATTVYLVSPDESGGKPGASGDTAKATLLYGKYDLTLTRKVIELPGTEGNPSQTNYDGIVVRMAVPYELGIKGTFFTALDKYGVAHRATNMFIVMLPDESHQYFLPLNRRPFVSTTTKVVLSNGMLQSYERNRPSVVAGVVGIPKTILSALVPIPLDVRQNQANNVQAIDKTLSGEADIKKLQAPSKGP